MLKIKLSKERHPFGYKKFHDPIGEVFEHIEDFQGIIYQTHWLIKTPLFSIVITSVPNIS